MNLLDFGYQYNMLYVSNFPNHTYDVYHKKLLNYDENHQMQQKHKLYFHLVLIQ